MKHRLRFEHKVTIAYLLLGGLWILFSDRVILSLFQDAQTLSQIQTYKGWFFVLITGLLFFAVLRWYVVRLRKAQAKAVESDRLKTAFLQNISHEVRTPMNAICGFSSLLNKENLSPEKRNFYTDIIINNSNQLLSIVNDVLSISNIETGQIVANNEQFALVDLIKKLSLLHKPSAESKGLEFIIQLENGVERIQMDTDLDKLKQLLGNIISNSIKFTHNGTVTLAVTPREGYICFTVQDTGIGIEDNMQQRVFERFIQANSKIQVGYGGTGLGLSIAKAYTELLGGTICLSSSLGMGTTVKVEIPANTSNRNYEHKGDCQEPAIAPPPNTKTILIADDEEHNFLFIEDAISTGRTRVIRANNGQEAVDICSKNSSIDMVIMDIRMPIMDGIEASKLIKRFRPSLPIIAHTAYEKHYDGSSFKKMNFDEYISKPLSQAKLINVINKYK